MSVLIMGMELPENCRDCRLSTVIAFDKRPLCDALVQYMSFGEWEAKRLDNCPLVPVPPHGRLIDADACERLDMRPWDAPTIIPAEEGET